MNTNARQHYRRIYCNSCRSYPCTNCSEQRRISTSKRKHHGSKQYGHRFNNSLLQPFDCNKRDWYSCTGSAKRGSFVIIGVNQ